MRIAFAFALALVLPAAPASAVELGLTGDFTQGGLVQGVAAPGARVALDGRAVRVSEDGVFVIGFGRDAKPEARLAVTWPDGRVERRTLAIEERKWRIQRIDGLPPRQVTPSAEDMKRIRADGAAIREARARDSAATWFQGGFDWPVTGRISGVFGSQRILNGKKRSPHSGTDVAAPKGTPVGAAAEGVVSLAESGMYFTGGTVVIDHGHGLSTVYAHLSAVEVRAGQRVAKGERIGRVGATGRVTGAHLHWGAHWFGTALDPALLAGPMPEDQPKP